MHAGDLQAMATEAAEKLKERVGPNGTAIVILSKADHDGPAVTAYTVGDPIRVVGALDMGTDLVHHGVRKAMNIDHIPHH